MSTQKSTGDLTREEIPEVRPRLAFDQIDLLLVYLLRHQTLFLEAMIELKPEHFNQPGEMGRGVVWGLAVDLYKRFQSIPNVKMIEAEALSQMDAQVDFFSDSVKREVSSLLEYAGDYDVATLYEHEGYGRDLLRYFLQERVIMDPLVALVHNFSAGVLKDPARLFSRLAATTARVNSIGVRASSALLPPDWRPRQESRISTGIDWLDLATDGGVVPRWTYGLFGPTGAFKTGTGIQIAVNAAQQFTAIAAGTDKPPKIMVYVVYEGGADAIRMRALGCASKIPHKRIFAHYGEGQPLSTLGNLQPYEADRYRDNPNRLTHLGEAERLETGLQRTANLHILDMSGTKENPSAGTGGIAEVVAALDRLRRETGQEIGGVVIDYAKIMVKRYVRAHSIPSTELRIVMGSLPDDLRRDIGEQFGCFCWILQQLNTSANRRAAGSAQHHSDSSEAGDFGENLFCCFTLSVVDKANGYTTQFNATKTRDGAGLSQPIILRIVGDEEQLVDASNRYTRSSTGRIVSRDVAESFVEAEISSVAVSGDGVPPPAAAGRRGAVPAGRRQPANPGAIGYAAPAPPPTEEVPVDPPATPAETPPPPPEQ